MCTRSATELQTTSSSRIMNWSNKLLYTQDNGQIKYGGPPSDWKGPAPSRGTEVFVSKLPRDASLSEICPVFGSVGKIYEARLMMDFSGTNRGFGFIQYKTKNEAKRAIAVLNHYEIRPGVQISVTKSIDNCRLFIGQVPKELRKEEIKSVLQELTTGVKDVILYLSPTDKRSNRGFCFVEYYDHRSAAMARRTLIATGGITHWGRTLRVDWAIPEEDVEEEVMSQVTVVYIRNLLLRSTEMSLKEVLCKIVTPDDFTRIKKVKDFAFVHFKTREAGDRAIRFINGFNLDGAELVATWAKPSPPTDDVSSNFKDKQKTDQKKKKTTIRNKKTLNQLFEDKTTSQTAPLASISSPFMHYSPGDNYLIPYSPQGLTASLNNLSVVPLMCSNNNFELNEDTLQGITALYLQSFQPSIALQYIISRLGWGDVYYNISYDLDHNTPTTFSAEVIIVRPDNSVYSPSIYHPLALTPVDAKDLVALVFINVYLARRASLMGKLPLTF